jgi:hypothetical protein
VRAISLAHLILRDLIILILLGKFLIMQFSSKMLQDQDIQTTFPFFLYGREKWFLTVSTEGEWNKLSNL